MPAILPANQTTAKLFLTGPFGSGKTSAAIDHVTRILRRERTRGDEILILVPQSVQGERYRTALRGPGSPGGAPVKIATVGGLARDAVELYWPLIAAAAGFDADQREPTFLNLETAQYHMRGLVEAAIQQADFDALRVHPNRIISQVLDNLGKAALHGFTIDEAYARLELAIPPGEHRTGQLNALRTARRISHEFRQLCLNRALVDFSLQTELFGKHILTNDWSRTHLFRSRRHLIVDNLEEHNAVTHDLIRAWLPHLESALLIYEEDGGYRLFLGADPEGANALRDHCDAVVQAQVSDAVSPAFRAAAHRVDRIMRPTTRRPDDGDTPPGSVFRIPQERPRFYPEMLTWVVAQVKHLVHEEGVAPGEIAIVAPFVSNALRFSLQNGLERNDIRSTTHRPSRALEEEPAARCLLTLARLAHPTWQSPLYQTDIALALQLSISRMDPIRAEILTRIIHPGFRRSAALGRFTELEANAQRRITYAAGEAYDTLRDWIMAYRTSDELLPLDQFLARLFGEVLSRPGFGFHDDYDAARVANQLVESARNFRWSLQDAEDAPLDPAISQHVGEAYLQLVESGAFGALYTPGWREPEDAVFIAPAYTFLMRNRVVDVQFWLDIGSSGWWERLYQPLTHPYVLSRHWPEDRPWTDLDEYQSRQELMRRVLIGLIRRTRKQIVLGVSDYAENGNEQRGPLLSLINRIISSAPEASTQG